MILSNFDKTNNIARAGQILYRRHMGMGNVCDVFVGRYARQIENRPILTT